MPEIKLSEFVKKNMCPAWWEHDVHVRRMFDYITAEETVQKMVLVSELGLPASCVVAKYCEDYCLTTPDCSLDLTQDWPRLGKLVRDVLELWGYRVLHTAQPMPGGLELRRIRSGAVYRRSSALDVRVSVLAEGEVRELEHCFEELIWMNTFKDFCARVTFAGRMADNSDAEAVYDIIRRPDVLIRMILLSEMSVPALAGCVCEIVDYCQNKPDCGLDLRELANRQLVGRMIKDVLEQLSYEVCSQGARLPKSLGLDEKLFKTASVYRRKPGVELDLTLRCSGMEDEAPLRHVFGSGERIGV